MMNIVLPILAAGVIAFCIFMYVTLDGFTLGIGMLMPFMNEDERSQAVSVILPNWDGNQTWLVLGGASLYGAFPEAFGTILPLLYLPILVMVIALLFRGVAFEFRMKSSSGKGKWDLCFMIGSLLATFVQGIVLGAFIQGFHFSETGNLPSLAWLSPYSLFTGIALVFGYTLLGATRLILKTEHLFAEKMRKVALKLCWMIAFFACSVSVWTPFLDNMIFYRWFQPSHFWLVILMPAITFMAWLCLLTALKNKREKAPFWISIFIFSCCYAGFAIGIWPYIMPNVMTIFEAASPPSSLLFMLIGSAIMLPILLIYTGYSYKIFGGKVRDLIHY